MPNRSSLPNQSLLRRALACLGCASSCYEYDQRDCIEEQREIYEYDLEDLVERNLLKKRNEERFKVNDSELLKGGKDDLCVGDQDTENDKDPGGIACL